ncbi:MAG: transcription-repair coupling factor [Dehalococcoidia bacterium]|nr:transcription-repair coupling factor [Dehalococcoidia bacterium]
MWLALEVFGRHRYKKESNGNERNNWLNLSGLLSLVEGVSQYGQILTALRRTQGEHQAVVLDNAVSAFVAALYRGLGLPLLLITSGTEGARRLMEQLQIWCSPGSAIHLLPEPDVLPYERLSSDPATAWERLRILAALTKNEAPLMVASPLAVAARTVNREDFVGAVQTLRPGVKLTPDRMLLRWQILGYEPEETVEVPGTFSRRGGILDIYPASSDYPVRVEFFGNEVESLRSFDPATQRSRSPIPEVTVIPAREVLLPAWRNAGRGRGHSSDNERLHQRLPRLDSCSDEARQRMTEELSQLDAGIWFPGAEFYAPLFNSGNFLDYLPRPSLVIMDDPSAVEVALEMLKEQCEQLRQDKVADGELPPEFPTPYLFWQELEDRFQEEGKRLDLWPWERHHEGKITTLGFNSSPSCGGKLDLLLREASRARGEGGRLVVVSQQASRLSELMTEENILAPSLDSLEGAPLQGSISLVQGSLAGGWAAGDGLTVLSDVEVFGSVKERRLPRKRPVRRQVTQSEITPGDHVVHVEHGIALFSGMTTFPRDGVEREYLVLEYAQGDRIYVPANHLDRISRYIGAGGAEPSLSRLRTQGWTRVKHRVRQSVLEMAQALLAFYASREVTQGFAFSPDSAWQAELEASFPYVETADQLEAAETVKREMEKPRPMDRLVCGDVGYGKTEVALRAAFKAVMESKQAAVLVPTTVLAQQHYATFAERLQPFPVNVEVLSRFRSEKEQKAVLQGLAAGTVDICIGTHRLLQKDVAFRDLGLVVIDEEQRFGVGHKERLKQMRHEVDVLTITATPIPRTMHMALAGVRDMSVIETPPEERLPIKTFVGEWDWRTVREAILRELERDGQVLLVHNRVQSIHGVAAELGTVVPEASIAVAHGQMSEEELEQVMADFLAGQSDVLVCTTIIESGLDMPRANTLVVRDAEYLGLTQLYQLRGRVGRASLRAYAYFLYPKGKGLTHQAKQRLSTIAQAGELGAGFRIAMKDLEIRGAGNLLGAEQSGHIAAVGFGLYSDMLQEAVAELQERRTGVKQGRPVGPGPKIDLPISVHLPQEYVYDLSTRLAIYHRLAAVDDEEALKEMALEMRDRFGPLPRPAEDLLYGVRIRLLADNAGVESVATEGKELVVRLISENPLRMQLLAAVYGEKIRVKSRQIRLDIRRLQDRWRDLLPKILVKLAGVEDSGAETHGKCHADSDGATA